MGNHNKTEEEKLEAKEKRKIYMREYKRRSYNKDKNSVIEYQRVRHFLKSNPNITKEDTESFSVMKADFMKLLCQIKKIQEVCPDELQEFLQSDKVF